jgi:hypothetical protein
VSECCHCLLSVTKTFSGQDFSTAICTLLTSKVNHTPRTRTAVQLHVQDCHRKGRQENSTIFTSSRNRRLRYLFTSTDGQILSLPSYREPRGCESECQMPQSTIKQGVTIVIFVSHSTSFRQSLETCLAAG